jgi:hypothetical protein
LVLLGFLLLGLLGFDSVRSGRDFGWFAYQQPGQWYLSSDQYPGVIVGGAGQYSDAALLTFGLWPYPSRGWRWAVLVLVTFVATVIWYGWRARRAGAASTRSFVRLVLGGALAIVVANVFVAWAGSLPNPAELVTTVGLPVALLGVVAGLYWRLGSGRRWVAMISLFCVFAGACSVLGWLAPPLVDPAIITGGLLGLAWLERSALLAFVAVAAFAGMVIFPAGVLSMLVPAMLLLGGAIAVLVRTAASPGPAPS